MQAFDEVSQWPHWAEQEVKSPSGIKSEAPQTPDVITQACPRPFTLRRNRGSCGILA